jgi:uncharacterized protein (TIGR01244 family)
MSDFRQVSESFWASPQIDLAQVAEARERGFAMVINNRPEGESHDQTAGAAIEAATQEAGMAYRAIPVTHAGFSEAQVREMGEALAAANGPVLAYCRSGTRSTLLWALAEAARGSAPEAIAQAAAGAGYDVASIRPLIDMLAARQASGTTGA